MASRARPQISPCCLDAGPQGASTERSSMVIVYLRGYGDRGKELANALGYRSSSSIPTALAQIDDSLTLARAVRKRLADD